MRIDVVSIFPDYLAPLELSLIGKARRRGLLDVRVHDLRRFTTDRHRTVDDTPYGGGAGMVMRPEPWGRALDAVLADGQAAPHLLVPSPAGYPFTQPMAQQLAGEPWLAFACGRYEGIDERVLADAATRMRVTPVSLGDYVLGGGEVAALVVIEAVTRLLPGVVGNPDSLTEESHTDGLLEYPVYTKPASWRGWDVPPVLLSGDHAAIAQWRTAQQLARTAGRRPDLLAVGAGPLDLDLALATPADAGELWTLQRACWLPESQHNPGLLIPALVETLEDVRAGLAQWRTVVGRLDGRLVASARARTNPDDDRTWEIGRLMVAPDLRGRGWGQQLLDLAASWAPPQTERWLVFTGAGSERNQRMYRRAGYRLRPDLPAPAGAVAMTKRHAGPRGS